jgi:hypothetical protein
MPAGGGPGTVSGSVGSNGDEKEIGQCQDNAGLFPFDVPSGSATKCFLGSLR